MPIYMRLKGNGTTVVFGLYDSRAEVERVCNVLKASNDAWEFYI